MVFSNKQLKSLSKIYLLIKNQRKPLKRTALLFFLNKFIFIYLFLAVLGLRCCAWAFSSCGELGLLFAAVRELLTAVASLVAEHGL